MSMSSIDQAPSLPWNGVVPLVWADSSRWGKVAVPDLGATTLLGEEEEPLFHRGEASEVLEGLGRDLGAGLLPVRMDALLQEAASPTAVAFPDAAVQRMVESLDVVWTSGSEITAGFVFETGPQAGEGIRRLADLQALHPKWKAPLYVVTDARLRDLLQFQVHRPVHRLLKRPLWESLRLLEWSRLREEVQQLGDRVRYLKPEFLEGISEPFAAA